MPKDHGTMGTRDGPTIAERSEPGDERVVRCSLLLKGTVQGVGFRPFVYHMAGIHGITGKVGNSGTGLVIEAEGPEEKVESFLKSLTQSPPALSQITSLQRSDLPPLGYNSFDIALSTDFDRSGALIPPDVATCPDCREEILNTLDRHYQYPFTNCTGCGPRFTIITRLPYDRPATSMRIFVMCPFCEKEYRDPGDRRFHAQPVACPACGPRAELRDRAGAPCGAREEWLRKAWDLLSEGRILALKGVGGFHLACDAKNPKAVETLRTRKGRKSKPLAVMCRNLETIQKYCIVGEAEKAALLSPAAPIVILERKPGCALPYALAPGLNSVAVMVPYSPLHILLLQGPCDTLVMTSGNRTGLPLTIDNERAFRDLGQVADFFLLHNREIVNRCDDSLLQVVDGETQFLRRSRGYVPHPIHVTPKQPSPVVLGIGGEMKNSFCLLRGDEAFMSQYIGEIGNLEGEENLRMSLLGFQRLIGAEPEIVAFDAHPEYSSAAVARSIPARCHVPVQHHHAHFASCLAENGFDGNEAIGVILDGTGYGTDGSLWGFEVLSGGYADFTREYHLAYVPLPGGEKAIREPWRTACAYLVQILGEEGKDQAQALFPDRPVDAVVRMAAQGFNSPLSSGCGRLFDAVSALLGICLDCTYEGQAAIELGEWGRKAEEEHRPYPYRIEAGLLIPDEIILAILADLADKTPVPAIAHRFLHTIACAVCDLVERVSAMTGVRTVALSGGTWQNPTLFQTARRMLLEQGFQVLYHRLVPANDGGIALGQAMVAHHKCKD